MSEEQILYKLRHPNKYYLYIDVDDSVMMTANEQPVSVRLFNSLLRNGLQMKLVEYCNSLGVSDTKCYLRLNTKMLCHYIAQMPVHWYVGYKNMGKRTVDELYNVLYKGGVIDKDVFDYLLNLLKRGSY